jgi:excisionase family DNA binding protein
MTTATAATKKPDLTAEGFADVQEAAAYLSVSRSLIYKLMETGDLNFAKFGKSRRIPWLALRQYAERCLVGASR